ncbi:hypothetical protein [Streptomyces sp. NPDC053431]|uniref:hypothetical protein n=1 Tax=Streptomyces sp. NPDC053431 TaxID=3365703 RepID=UPI0037D8E422
MVRTRLKLAATLTVVVLALTGFQTSSSGGHGSGKSSSKSGKSKSGGGGGGGGCSSSKKKNDDYDDYEGGTSGGYGGSGSSTYTPSPTTSPTAGVEVFVVSCVEPAQKKRKGKPARKADTTATLKIVSRDATAATYKVVLEFKGSNGSAVDRAEAVVSVDGHASKAFEVAMKNPKAVAQVKNCYVYDVRKQPEGSATPTPTPTGTATPTASAP